MHALYELSLLSPMYLFLHTGGSCRNSPTALACDPMDLLLALIILQSKASDALI